MSKIAERIKTAITNRTSMKKNEETEITVHRNDLIVTVKQKNIAVIGKHMAWISYCGLPHDKLIQNRIREILHSLNLFVGPKDLDLTNIMKKSTTYHPVTIPGNF